MALRLSKDARFSGGRLSLNTQPSLGPARIFCASNLDSGLGPNLNPVGGGLAGDLGFELQFIKPKPGFVSERNMSFGA